MTNKPIWSWVEKPKVKFFVFLILSICTLFFAVHSFLANKALIGLVFSFITVIDVMICIGGYLSWKNKI